MIVLRINMHVLPEKQKEVVQTLLSLMSPMKKEPGCLSHALFCDILDDNLLCVLEEWESREKLNRHLNSDIFGVLLGTKSLLHEVHGIHIYTVERIEGPEAVRTVRDTQETAGGKGVDA